MMTEITSRLSTALADRYAIERELGSGGMATVYLAEDLKHKRKVAVKVLRPELAALLGAERFLQEITTTANLQHPHILPLFDSGEADGFLFYVMPFVDGETLRDKLNSEKQIGIDEAVRITIEIADALDYAHRHNIVHRDIKPENILLHDGRPMVADFGIALAVSEAGGERLTETGLAVGTPTYMSPEQASGESDLDGRVDVYALGCMLYEMLAGEPPYTGSTARAIVAKHLTDPVPSIRRLRDTVPVFVDRAINKALAKTKADRFATPVDFASALENPTAGTASVSRFALLPWATIAAVVLLVALNVGGLRDIMLRPFSEQGSTDIPAGVIAVAVLPMQNITGARQDDYFAAGMTEEIIGRLGSLAAISVPARTSVLQYAERQIDIRDIGSELGAAYVLESSVRKSGTTFRITARLANATTGLDDWSQDFDGELDDVFRVQEEVALQIATALDVHLSVTDERALRHRYTENTEAYDAYRRGWALLESTHGSSQGIKEKLDAARLRFGEALDLDENYPLALAGLATTEAVYHLLVEPDSALLVRAEDLARRALAIDSEIADAFAAIAVVNGLKGDFGTAIEDFRQAIRLDEDNAYYWCDLAWACINRDPPATIDGEEAAREAVRLHPGYFWSHLNLGQALALQSRHAEAVESYEFAAQLEPVFRTTYLLLGRTYIALERYEEALLNFETARGMSTTAGLLATIGGIHAAMGDTGAALTELEQAFEAGYRDFESIEGSQHYALLSDNEQFRSLIERYRARD